MKTGTQLLWHTVRRRINQICGWFKKSISTSLIITARSCPPIGEMYAVTCHRSRHCQKPREKIQEVKWRTKGCRVGPGNVLLLLNTCGRANSIGMSESERVYAWPENCGGRGEDARSCKNDFGESRSGVWCIGVCDCASSGVKYACKCVCAIDVVGACRGM